MTSFRVKWNASTKATSYRTALAVATLVAINHAVAETQTDDPEATEKQANKMALFRLKVDDLPTER
jgi:hypothetical protein